MSPTPPELPSLHVAVLDTETTGLSSKADRLVEVAVKLLHVDGSARLLGEVDAYQSLHDPGIRIPWAATAVHGITDAMVRGHRIDPLRLEGILRRADLVVAHNVGFDKGFVRQLVPDADGLLWGCSCRGIPWKKLYPRLWSTSLPELARSLRVPAGQAHRALGDVETTVRLLLQPDPSGTPHLQHLVAKKVKVKGKARLTGVPPPPPPPSAPIPPVDADVAAARDYVLRVLRQFPDHECSIADLHGWHENRRQHGYDALTRAAAELRQAGLLRATVEADRVAYWSLA